MKNSQVAFDSIFIHDVIFCDGKQSKKKKLFWESSNEPERARIYYLSVFIFTFI